MRGRTRPRRLHRAERVADRLLGRHRARTRSACSRRTGATPRPPRTTYCFDYLPRIDGDHSTYQTALDMARRQGARLHRHRREPGRRLGRTGAAAARACEARSGSSCATSSRSRRRRSGTTRPRSRRASWQTEEIGTEVFFLPAASHVEKDGSFTNTQRLLQWHDKAVEPPGDCRSELWFYFHLGRIVREKLAARGRADDRDRPVLDLTWDYPVSGRARRADGRGRAARDQRLRAPTAKPLSAYTELKDDGSTAAAAGSTAAATPTGRTRRAAQSGREQTWVAPEWGWAWPANRRILYNRASADPDGQPWSERKRYVWWDAEQETLDGRGRARLPARRSAPDYVPPTGAKAEDQIAGHAPVHHAGRRARLAVRARGARRRAAADALRAARVAVREPALRAVGESRAPAVPAPAQPLQPEHRRPGSGGTRTCSRPTA